MMQNGWLDGASSLLIPAFGAGSLLVMVLSAIAGQTLRRWWTRGHKQKPHESTASVEQESLLLGGVMALLGLLMAFSFAMVIGRYEARRGLAVQEANAIGTAYLRAQFLDEPHRTQLSHLLVDYTDNRIKLATVEGQNRAYMAQNDRLLTEIWAAVRASRESALAHGMTTTLLTAFNEVIDLDTERKVAWELRLPADVIILLFSYLMITSAVVGYQIDGPRGKRAALVLFVLIALSLTVITDINRPLSGWERESQKPMLMLLQSLRSQPPQVFDQFSAGGGQAAP